MQVQADRFGLRRLVLARRVASAHHCQHLVAAHQETGPGAVGAVPSDGTYLSRRSRGAIASTHKTVTAKYP
jgi:hypothetical protein